MCTARAGRLGPLASMVALTLAGGCDNSSAIGPPDAFFVGPFDLAHADLAGLLCLPDPGRDGVACSPYCPANSGTVPVAGPNGCQCWDACDPTAPLCPCGRVCEPLLAPTDMGAVPLSIGACLAANGPGERCATDGNGKPFGHGLCQPGTRCVHEEPGGALAYCMYTCDQPADCPTGSTCLPATGANVKICLLDNEKVGGKALGAACQPGDLCGIGALCDGVCRPQCDGPSDLTTCQGGAKCGAFVDARNHKTAAWLCR